MPSDDIRPLAGLPVEIAWGNLLNPATLIEAFEGIDVVYHVAGQVSIASTHEQLVENVNVGGTRNAIAACIKTGVRRLVYCSSIHALVEPPAGTIVDESCGFDPSKSRGGYDRSKAQASLAGLGGSAGGFGCSDCLSNRGNRAPTTTAVRSWAESSAIWPTTQ